MNRVAILHLEDNAPDADMVRARLAECGLDFDLTRVDSRAAFAAALEAQRYDLILAVYGLPDFDGLAALAVARAKQPEAPFLFVSGKLGEDVAVDTLHRGATDYVLKQRLDRLVPAVRRALAEAAERHKRLQAEEALRQNARRKDQFLAMLAHELRNPLNPIRNAVHILRFRGDAKTIDQVRELIDRQVGHLTRLVDDLLDVSRINRGKMALRPERLDLGRVVRLNVEDNRGLLEGAGLAVAVEVPATPVWVHGDATRLAQVMDNLLQNAAKFTGRGGSVHVRLTVEAEGRAIVSVRDTGIGIDSEMLAQLFEPFAQADRSLERSKGGLGLGLALVKGLVELHGGGVKAVSEGLGRGTEFTFWMPQEEEPAALSGGPVLPHSPGKQLKILVVEDNRDSADSLRVLLELFGYEVTVAYTGPDGLAAARQHKPDVVVCDIGLPGMDGFAVANALRQSPETAATRLIAVTGYGREEDRRRAFEAGFDEHLVKPVDPEKLLGQIAP